MKGTVEAVLQRCTHYHQNVAVLPLSQEKHQQISAISTEWGRHGLRGTVKGSNTIHLYVICMYFQYTLSLAHLATGNHATFAYATKELDDLTRPNLTLSELQQTTGT